MEKDEKDDVYVIEATGDVVAGDRIRFTEAVFGGTFRRPQYIGDRTVEAEVLRDSYGKVEQQHTFTIRIIRCEGVEPLAAGTITHRKGRNIYRRGVWRAPWADEAQRVAVQRDKWSRGDAAREQRARRLAEEASAGRPL